MKKFNIHDKNSQKNKNRGNFPDLVKSIYKQLIANIIFNGKKRNAFPLRMEIRQRCLSLTPFSRILLEILASLVSQENEIKCIQIKKEELKLGLQYHHCLYRKPQGIYLQIKQKLLELSKCSKITSYKINIHKFIVFSYTKNEHLDIGIKNTNNL